MVYNILDCIHIGCITNFVPVVERGHMFCFPRNNHLRERWLKQLNRNDLVGIPWGKMLKYRVCRFHFKDADFCTSEKKKLLRGSVPLKVDQDVVDEQPNPRVEQQEVELAETSSDNESISSLYALLAKEKSRYEKLYLHFRRKKFLILRDIKLSDSLSQVSRLLKQNRRRSKIISKKCKKTKDRILSHLSFKNINNIYQLPVQLRIFVLSLLKKFLKAKKFRRYSLDEKALFISIMKHCPRSYRYLKKILSIPSVKSLQHTLYNFQVKTGINSQLFKYLNIISNNLPEQERYCTLIFGDTEIDKCFNDKWSGADQALVFMIRGITGKWKQPLAFYFTCNADKYTLKKLISEVVQTVHDQTNFEIVASVCVGGLRNIAAIRLLSVESDRVANKFIYNIGGHEIVHLFDPPYLLKCMRNTFMTKNIEFEGKLAKWSDIEFLYELDQKSEDKFRSTKLTNAHVNPSSRQKMRVKLASQTFSRKTAAMLAILTATKVIEASGTSTFVMFMNRLFDSLNSVSLTLCPIFRNPTENSIHFQFWEKAKRTLADLKFISGGESVDNPRFIYLLIATIRNVLYLCESLKNRRFKDLSIRSLNQDPLDNLFNIIRGLCNGKSKPSTLQFIDAFKTVIINNIPKCSIESNCEDDGDRILLSYSLLTS